MHVRIEGKASIQEAISAFSEALKMLTEHGVVAISDMNIYCSIYDSEGYEREVTGEHGEDVSIFYKANINPKPIKIATNPRVKNNPRFKSKPANRAVA